MNATRGGTVLVVEDEPGTATLQQRRLERAGYRVFSVPTVTEAMERIERGDVELVVLDYRLSGGTTGLEFYESLKAAGYDLPVIMVTGYSSESTAVQALRAGVRDFVVKSMEYLEYLPTAVDRALSQVHLERELADSRAQLAGIIRSAMDAIITTDREGNILEFNPAAEAMFGHVAAGTLDKNLIDLVVPPPLREPCRRNWEAFLIGGEGRFIGKRVEVLAYRSDGTVFPAELAVTESTVVGRMVFTGFIRDLTERKRAEEAIRDSEERYRRIVDTAAEGIWVVTAQGEISFANQRMASMLGYTTADLIGQPITRFAENAEWAKEAYAVAPRSGGSPSLSDYQLRCNDGRIIWIMVSASALYDPQGKYAGCLAMVTDLTERKRLEEQFHHSQKMEAVGQLAGGVAHDFNNLLTVILGYCELLRDSELPKEAWKECLKEVSHAGERAAALTRQLLAFSRKQILTPVVLDLKTLITDLNKMLRRMVRENIVFTVDLHPSLGRVRADPGQLEQVLMNLVVNAGDAMPRGGQLTINAANIDLAQPKKNGGEIPAGPYVVLSVHDTGIGMDEEVKAHIFEPFFTTKDPGKGTGLGLATVFGIVTQSGGLVEVDSEPGKGSTFRVYLPRLNGDAPVRDSLHGAAPFPRGQETVLLVEDEEGVRALARLALQSAGYTVLETHDGGEALRTSREHRGNIDLVVTDVVMPGVSGLQLAAQLTTERKGVKVLYLSGYTDDTLGLHGLLEAGATLLQKPFTPQQLARKVREVLDK